MMLSPLSPFYTSHCIQCRLPETHCVCNKIKQVDLPFKIMLCCHSKEWQRNDNTGQWALLSSESIGRIKWHRKAELIYPAISIEALTNEDGHYLLFPADDAVDIQPLFQNMDSSTIQPAAHPAVQPISTLWVIDGTWQEAQKMLRQSPWLKAMPKVKIQASAGQTLVSQFQLRRNQQGLCTMEAIAAAVACRSELAAKGLQQNFTLCQNALLDLLR
jgi:DTW domain-containing protein YfiP